tara:strand:- start:486 stop:752 length:267 start_codon:yes stop_codon:yes gene_type:complete
MTEPVVRKASGRPIRNWRTSHNRAAQAQKIVSFGTNGVGAIGCIVTMGELDDHHVVPPYILRSFTVCEALTRRLPDHYSAASKSIGAD